MSSTENAPAVPLPPRRRDPEAHRAAILAATREALAENGYARTTIRDIARRAGVTHGLVMRHFGSKEKLLIAALPANRDLDRAVEGDLQSLPERVAHTFVQRMETGVTEDAFVALIRSAATNEVATVRLYDEMRRASAASYHRVLNAKDLDDRIDLLGALLIGITFERYVVRSGSLAQMSADRLERYLAELMRHILGPALPGAR